MTAVSWCAHTWCDEQPAWGRWDQLWLGRVLAGDEGRPPLAFDLVEADFDTVRRDGGILVVPVGHYHDHGEKHIAVQQLWKTMLAMPWGIVIGSSDEGSTFEWHKIDPWPDHIQLYVQLPRVEHTYPPGTRFYGEGSPTSASEVQEAAAFTRDLDVFLSAQGGHVRRVQCFDAIRSLEGRAYDWHKTDGFTQGFDRDEYLFRLTRSWIAPAPSGILSPSSFRAFEALEAGAIPIVDGVRPDGGGQGYWEMIGLGDVVPVIDDWSMLGAEVDDLLRDREFTAARVSSGWQRYKRDFVAGLHDSIEDIGVDRSANADGPHDEITVIIPTSPIPSNPDLGMIQEVIQSIRIDLPGAEILITCDGIRDEQPERLVDYHSFLHRLCVWTLTQHNVTPFVFNEHLHQSGMMRAVLDEVSTKFVLYVEHDCPIVGPVPWADLVSTMERHQLTSMRLMHEASVLPEHEHLFVTTTPQAGEAPWLPTMQWSQRPHLARTDWYASIMGAWFGSEARTMIEDVMHGVTQHGMALTDGKPTVESWERWRMACYAPEGSMKRSGHLDGRGDDPKFPMLIDYDGEAPFGAPRKGWRDG